MLRIANSVIAWDVDRLRPSNPPMPAATFEPNSSTDGVPVFVADGRRRHRAVRLAAATLGLLLAGWLAALTAGLIGFAPFPPLALPGSDHGHAAPAALPQRSGAAPAAPAASRDARIPRSSDGKSPGAAARGRSGAGESSTAGLAGGSATGGGDGGGGDGTAGSTTGTSTPTQTQPPDTATSPTPSAAVPPSTQPGSGLESGTSPDGSGATTSPDGSAATTSPPKSGATSAQASGATTSPDAPATDEVPTG